MLVFLPFASTLTPAEKTARATMTKMRRSTTSINQDDLSP